MLKIFKLKNILTILTLFVSMFFIIEKSWAEITQAGGGTEGAAAGATDEVGFESSYDFSIYDKFKYGDAMNWGDCYDMKPGGGVDICPGYPPYTSPFISFSYWEPLAMVEVVPDAWQSFLYKESFYNFTSKSTEPKVMGNGIGAGYRGTKQSSSGKEYIGQHKLESHVWAVSDIWRLKSSDFMKACYSFTCKAKNWWFPCIKVLKNTFTMATSMVNTVKSINGNQEGEGGKGQGARTGENGEKVVYEDGSVYEEKPIDPEHPEKGTEFVETRPPGNYGGGVLSGDLAAGAVDYSTMANLSTAMNYATTAVDFAKNPVGTLAGGAMGIAGDYVGSAVGGLTSKLGNAVSTTFGPSEANPEGYSPNINVESGPDKSALPESTKASDTTMSEPASMNSSGIAGGANSAEAGNQVSNQNTGQNSQGMQNAAGSVMSQVSGMMNGLGDSFGQAMEIVDMVTFFNPIEFLIQMIAEKAPIMLHPIFMTERHQKASNTGGFIMAPIFQGFAKMGAGMIMPLFCLSKTGGMAIAGVSGLAGIEIPTNFLGTLSNFINGRCVGSWGPLEPRLNFLGTGDDFVAAGLASVRALNIAQNLTDAIVDKPFNELKFNLDWPHQSKCYGFQGLDGLSRSWESPIMEDAADLTNAIKSGNMGALRDVVTGTVKDSAKTVRKTGGKVFTYWKHRKCRYVYGCKSWRGDVGGK